MILQSLVKLYENLAPQGKVPIRNFSNVRVSFAAEITENGELRALMPLKETVTNANGKKSEISPMMIVPEMTVRSSGIKANFLCDNSSFIFGIGDGKKASKVDEKFSATKELTFAVLKDVDSPAVKAIKSFFEQFDIETASENDVIKRNYDELLKGGNIVFLFEGKYLHDYPEIRNAWNEYKEHNASGTKMQCLVTGKMDNIATIHPKIKGIRDAQSVGACLVGFNASSFESYGCADSQGLNAPVSEYAAFAYTTALNYLLSDREHSKSFGGTTYVYWTEDDDQQLQKVFNDLTFDISDDLDWDKELDGLMKNISYGKSVDDSINFKKRFYILGLSPNAARASVRFFYVDTFGNILKNIVEHYKRLEIEKNPNQRKILSPYWLLMETVSPNASKKEPLPNLAGAVYKSIISGTMYPAALYSAVLMRIRAEHEVTYGKAAIIKAYFLRKYQNEKLKEEFTVSLMEESKNVPYLLGRLFAVLEKAQKDANGTSTIKERYFSSASATPATVFPILLALSAHHIAKLDNGGRYEKQIAEIIDMLDEDGLPSRLSLEEQGPFYLGYYHQNQAMYRKKQNTINESEEN